MRILFAASEAHPYASTGGLAGVAGSLPAALAQSGHQVSLVMPFYGCIRGSDDPEWMSHRFTTFAGEQFGVARSVHPLGGFPVYLVSRDEHFDRKGIYGPDPGSAYPDNAARFAFFCRAVVALCESLPEPPELIHCHDWQTGLVPVYLRNSIRPAVVLTIHNLHYQGNFPRDDYGCTCLPWSLFTMQGLEFYGTFSFLKGGILCADRITTVSRTYAREIQTPGYGEGLDGVLVQRSNALSGIVNGIDSLNWNPSSDPALAASYSAGSISRRKECRRDLLRVTGQAGGGIVAGVVSRLTGQKGLDILFPVMEVLVREGMGFVVLGTGESSYEKTLAGLQKKYPGKISAIIRYDDTMARKIFAGSDVLVMPSRFEPCGLAQMIGMRYGAVPLVRRTGGLADTVDDVDQGGCGFVFRKPDPDHLLKTFRRAVDLYNRRNRWAWLVKKCMERDNSWDSRVGAYEEVYREAMAERSGR
ncbi:MAG: glycogen synthase GlgA [Candidatus Fermentibacteraceae bacterium]|nr:glycogen synthase GlgA [Candidatus Fermentibacteraceae bacterium]MBN2609519.1 glycogen synthase GlgA [Candidatus Fermentibacteraceae bacterium]